MAAALEGEDDSLRVAVSYWQGSPSGMNRPIDEVDSICRPHYLKMLNSLQPIGSPVQQVWHVAGDVFKYNPELFLATTRDFRSMLRKNGYKWGIVEGKARVIRRGLRLIVSPEVQCLDIDSRELSTKEFEDEREVLLGFHLRFLPIPDLNERSEVYGHTVVWEAFLVRQN